MKYLCLNKIWKINEEYNIDKLLYLMIDRPDEINQYNELFWKNNKEQLYRNYDLPSLIYLFKDKTCSLIWFKNNMYHSEKTKPAYIDYNGYKQYYTNDKFIKGEWSKNEISLSK